MINGLPEKLHAQRTKYGFSQRQVADKLGVSSSIISGYETGERTPSVEILLALSYLYKCSTDYLLGRQTSGNDRLLNVESLSTEQLHALQIIINSMR